MNLVDHRFRSHSPEMSRRVRCSVKGSMCLILVSFFLVQAQQHVEIDFAASRHKEYLFISTFNVNIIFLSTNFQPIHKSKAIHSSPTNKRRLLSLTAILAQSVRVLPWSGHVPGVDTEPGRVWSGERNDQYEWVLEKESLSAHVDIIERHRWRGQILLGLHRDAQSARFVEEHRSKQ